MAFVERFSKPFDYFALGKSFSQGREFMLHMKQRTLSLAAEATTNNGFVTVDGCPVCGNKKIEKKIEFFGFPYSRCTSDDCGHVFVARALSDSMRNKFFASDQHYSSANYCNSERVKFRKEQIAKPKVDFVLEVGKLKPGRWLDVGCGSGEVLSVLKDYGWEVLGLEISDDYVEFGRKEFGIEILNQTLDRLASTAKQKFDVVSFFGVVHCLHDPKKLLEDAQKVTAPSGVTVIDTDHFDSLSSAAALSFPDNPTRSSFNPITTLHQFTISSIQKLFEKTGYAPLGVWYFGADFFEVLNQFSFLSADFPNSALFQELLKHSSALQEVFDKSRLSEEMLWIARSQR